MSHFAEELRAEGYEVDYRHAASMRAGLEIHREETSVTEVVAIEPNSWTASQLLEDLGVQLVPNNQFLCSSEDFVRWSQSRKSLRMEDFYRWQRKRHGSDGRNRFIGRPVELRCRKPETSPKMEDVALYRKVSAR